MVILIFILSALAWVSNAFMDTLYTLGDRLKINHKFFNPYRSHANKWKNGDHKQGEKFFLSSTVLVAFTDGWHLAKLIMLCFLIAAQTVALFTTPPEIGSGFKSVLIVGAYVLGFALTYFIVFETAYRTFKKKL